MGPIAEAVLGCEIVLGARADLVFPAHRLDAANSKRFDPTTVRAGEDEPIRDDFAACVVYLIELGLDEARPTIDGIAGRLGLSRRTLQRRLEGAGTRYVDLQRGVL
ncbi:hypothetical protein [Methylobacterium gregans]|uniref:Uncharacterized protein n=1 Tax=Methylobacterium gregans TaxID=374424 RepID=A0AA37HPI5_9HYPH|nr:hypothetical protein [Methylobacterium gregans]MDQ0519510.1 transcriptional regulator with PAS, ATPase and Fis domain [Methylobacterium gregans]GJD79284.1 hypothetical protein NBEOAGPD_2508 [Methylobacterium gregans]GLS52849.1 hypothetical protein GCM10007886_10320 [Methylobacterium gregans]